MYSRNTCQNLKVISVLAMIITAAGANPQVAPVTVARKPLTAAAGTGGSGSNRKPTTSLAVQPPDTINDLASYILSQIAQANSLEGLEGLQNRQTPSQALTPTPILFGGQTCVLCTLVSDLVLGVSTFVFGSLRGIWQLTGVPFVNLAVTVLSPFIILARVIINFSSMVTGFIARAFVPVYGNGDPNQFLSTYWGITNALAYGLLFWPARILVQEAIIPFFQG